MKIIIQYDVTGPMCESSGTKEYMPAGKQYVHEEERFQPEMVNVSGKMDVTYKTKYHPGQPFLAKDQSTPGHKNYLKHTPYTGDAADSRD